MEPKTPKSPQSIHNSPTDRLTFLGSAGARIMVSKQLLASGGLWLDLGGTQVLLDPGPGSLVQCVKRKLDPTRLRAIILSHRHLDHSGDINAMIEAMTEGGFRKRGTVFAPADALEDDPVILRYIREYPGNIEVLAEGGTYTIDDITLETPLRHRHPVETYGLVFRTPRHTFSCIVDSEYFPGLSRQYGGELLIINTLRLEPGGPAQHLSVPDAREIILALRPRVAILTHFGMTMWRARPWEVAKTLSEETGVRVLAARDGMKFDLAELDDPEESSGAGPGDEGDVTAST
ncbi:MAG: MBL fold metallo-hydrolase [Dehalococcoidia bacterium]